LHPSRKSRRGGRLVVVVAERSGRSDHLCFGREQIVDAKTAVTMRPALGTALLLCRAMARL
jgi:hypothetical protein